MSPTRARFRPPCEQTQRRFGRIDALVNNAGIAVFKPMLDVTLEEWQRVLAVNLTGPFLMTQAVAPIMRDQGGGAIVNITSISGLRASTLRVAYGTSKAGLAHLTKQQAAELGEYGIRVNAVAPGPVDTAMAKAVHTPAIRADYHDHIPLNRYGLETGTRQCDLFPVRRPGGLHHRPGAGGGWRLRCRRRRLADAAEGTAQSVNRVALVASCARLDRELRRGRTTAIAAPTAERARRR